jgi:hypothetical protein
MGYDFIANPPTIKKSNNPINAEITHADLPAILLRMIRPNCMMTQSLGD